MDLNERRFEMLWDKWFRKFSLSKKVKQVLESAVKMFQYILSKYCNFFNPFQPRGSPLTSKIV